MRDRKVATRYAEALLASAKAEGVLDERGRVLRRRPGCGEGQPRPAHLPGQPPGARPRRRRNCCRSVFGGKIEPVLLNFFHLLLDKNRIENIRDIGEEFADLVETEQGIVRAQVVTADRAAGRSGRPTCKSKLAACTGKKIILEKKVDPAVIGGVCVTLGDKILDGTVRTNLDLLRKTLGQAQVR